MKQEGVFINIKLLSVLSTSNAVTEKISTWMMMMKIKDNKNENEDEVAGERV